MSPDTSWRLGLWARARAPPRLCSSAAQLSAYSRCLFACVIACALRPSLAPPEWPAHRRTNPGHTRCDSWGLRQRKRHGRDAAAGALSASVVCVVVRHAGVHLWREPVLQACKAGWMRARRSAERAAAHAPSSGFMPRHLVHDARPMMLPAWPTTACGPRAASSPNATGTLSNQGAAGRASERRCIGIML